MAGAAFPTRPRAPRQEQLALPLDGTIAGRYQQWRQTPEGRGAWWCISQMALVRANAGRKRIGAKALVEWAREHQRCQINNDFTPEIARELEATFPDQLRGKFQLRQRNTQ